MAKLNEIQPDALAIAGYSNPAMLAALRWCRLNDCIPVLMSETSEADFNRNPLKEWLKRRIVKQFKSALVGGAPQERYLVKLGMDPKVIFAGYDVVDNGAFTPATIRALPRPNQNPYFLAINRFIPKKNLSLMIAAYASYREQASEPWDLVICGDGDLRPELESQVSSCGMDGVVHMPGFLQQVDILPYLAHAGCFVHASTREQWGLVINEAMASGLPVILSNRCGCFEDLVKEGINGYGFDPQDANALTSLMVKMSSRDVDLDAMSTAALEHIAHFSPDTFADGLLLAAGVSNLP